MTAEGSARAMAKMVRWGKWERNVLVLCEGSLDSNGRLRFNEQFAHLALQRGRDDPINPDLEARIAWLREKWAHAKKITFPVATPSQQYEGHFLPMGPGSYGARKV
jgi:hypothetical protein